MIVCTWNSNKEESFFFITLRVGCFWNPVIGLRSIYWQQCQDRPEVKLLGNLISSFRLHRLCLWQYSPCPNCIGSTSCMWACNPYLEHLWLWMKQPISNQREDLFFALRFALHTSTEFTRLLLFLVELHSASVAFVADFFARQSANSVQTCGSTVEKVQKGLNTIRW